jgi:hypothetical protein
MAGPKKSLRPKARPKNLDTSIDKSPRAERNERKETMGNTGRPQARTIDMSPRAERNERKEVMGMACGGMVHKKAGGGMCRGMGAASRGGMFGRNG